MNLKRTSLKSAGVDKKGVENFLAAVKNRGIELHDLMLVRGGKVCYEASWYPYEKEDLHMLYSLSKAFTALAIGFAVQEKKLSVEDKAAAFFEQELQGQLDEKVKRMTVEHLLTMCTGQEMEPPILNYEVEGNWVQKFFEITPVHEPGTHFFYDTTATYILSAIITKVTGEKLVDYLRPRLFEPLGITDYYWDESPQGNTLSGIGLNVTIETVAKLGVFLQQQGMWEGEQLLNKEWMQRMVSNLVDSSGGEIYSDGNDWGVGYGYQIWQCIPEGVYRGDGAYGQFSIVAPEKNLVIATLTGTEDMGGLMEEMWKHLLPACHDVENEEITEGESDRGQFSVCFPEGEADGPKGAGACQIMQLYNIEKNEEELKSIVLNKEKNEDTLWMTCEFEDGTKRTLAYGYRQWKKNEMPGVKFSHYYTCADIRKVNTAGAYAWKDGFLHLKLCYLNGPLGVTAEIQFADGKIIITGKKHRSMDRKVEYEFQGKQA